MQRLRASAVCVDAGELLCVRLRDPLTRVARLFVPGGGLEPGESAAQAAAREALEETGYAVAIDASSEHVARYPFRWAGLEVDCTTHFFRARLTTARSAPEVTHDAAYNEGVVWLKLAEIDQAFAYHDAILAAVSALARG
jgi:8-oxo-dGTP pyrophosphatase MutT (NUDIX family)